MNFYPTENTLPPPLPPSRRRLLFSKQEAMDFLDVGEKVFDKLAIAFVLVGKRKKYALADLEGFIRQSRQEPVCLSPVKGRGRPITGMTSRSAVIGFEEARKQIALKLQRQL